MKLFHRALSNSLRHARVASQQGKSAPLPPIDMPAARGLSRHHDPARSLLRREVGDLEIFLYRSHLPPQLLVERRRERRREGRRTTCGGTVGESAGTRVRSSSDFSDGSLLPHIGLFCTCSVFGCLLRRTPLAKHGSNQQEGVRRQVGRRAGSRYSPQRMCVCVCVILNHYHILYHTSYHIL